MWAQSLRLGDKTFTIAAVLKQEPDRILAGAGLGPRVMISSASLDQTGLRGFRQPRGCHLLVKLPENHLAQALRDAEIAGVRSQLEARYPTRR